MPTPDASSHDAASMTSAEDRAYKIGAEALTDYQTDWHGDIRLDAHRASAKVISAVLGAGLVIVERADLDAYVNRDGTNLLREVDGLNALLAALGTEKPHA